MRTRELKVGFVVIVVMCACAFFTTQCDGIGKLPEAIYVAPGEPEIPEEPEDTELDYIVWYNKFADELNGRVECSSPAKTGKEFELVGKWKLILRINGTDTVDCSCEEVIYHFKPDQTLSVSIGNETAEDVAYEYEGYPFSPLCFTFDPRPNLKMGSSEVYCYALPKMMYLYPQMNPEREEFGIFPLFEINWIFIRID